MKKLNKNLGGNGMKMNIDKILIRLSVVVIMIFIIGDVSADDWWNSDWKYKKKVNITEGSGETLSDYQVLIELNSTNFNFTNARPSGEDIRFVDSDVNKLNYWVEEWDVWAKKAKIWVKVPKISANKKEDIWMYYGNEGAMDAGNGDATFELFDDFNYFDSNKWTIRRFSNDANKECVFEEGYMKLVKKSMHKGCNILANNFRISHNDQKIIEFKFFIDYVCGNKNDGDGIALVIDGKDNEATCYACNKGFSTTRQGIVVKIHNDFPDGENGNGIGVGDNTGSCLLEGSKTSSIPYKTSDLNDGIVSVKLTGTQIVVDYKDLNPSRGHVSKTLTYNLWDLSGSGYLMLGAGSDFSCCGVEDCNQMGNRQQDSGHYIDWIFVREYASLEPNVSVGPQETCGNGICEVWENCDTCLQDCECGESEICCDGVCRTPVCSLDSDCNDGTSCTVDNCNDPGTCNASCTYINMNYTEPGKCCSDIWYLNVECCNDNDCNYNYFCNKNKKCEKIRCGDGICNGEETCCLCPQDCGFCMDCGDGVCSPEENCSSCSIDCGFCPKCGDGVCSPEETRKTCPVDCGPEVVCGDGKCGYGENYSSCSPDCKKCKAKIKIGLDKIQEYIPPGYSKTIEVPLSIEAEDGVEMNNIGITVGGEVEKWFITKPVDVPGVANKSIFVHVPGDVSKGRTYHGYLDVECSPNDIPVEIKVPYPLVALNANIVPHPECKNIVGISGTVQNLDTDVLEDVILTLMIKSDASIIEATDAMDVVGSLATGNYGDLHRGEVKSISLVIELNNPDVNKVEYEMVVGFKNPATHEPAYANKSGYLPIEPIVPKPNGTSCSYDCGCSSNCCCHGTCRPVCPYCGDDICDPGENYFSCPEDCPLQLYLLFIIAIALIIIIAIGLWRQRR